MDENKRYVEEVLVWHNKLRTDPQGFIKYLEDLLKLFSGYNYTYPGEPMTKTYEGPKAVHEAIDFLRKQKPLKPLQMYEGLCKSAQDHVNDQGPRGTMGHDGSDGSRSDDRIRRHMKPIETAENISYMSCPPRRVIMALLVDDNVPSRGHRTNMFNERMNYCGIAVGKHSIFRKMCVLNYAGDIEGPEIDFSNYPEEVLVWHNKLRTDPQSFIPLLEDHLAHFQGNLYKYPGEIPVSTTEGPKPVKEAIEFLRNVQAVSPLSMNDGLCKVAQDQANKGGKDKSFLPDRINRYVSIRGGCCERSQMAKMPALRLILTKLVSDGNSSRESRSTLFDDFYQYCGIAVADHSTYGKCVTIVYAVGIAESSTVSTLSPLPILAASQPKTPIELPSLKQGVASTIATTSLTPATKTSIIPIPGPVLPQTTPLSSAPATATAQASAQSSPIHGVPIPTKPELMQKFLRLFLCLGFKYGYVLERTAVATCPKCKVPDSLDVAMQTTHCCFAFLPLFPVAKSYEIGVCVYCKVTYPIDLVLKLEKMPQTKAK
jgi:uncharacterized protein YkwD